MSTADVMITDRYLSRNLATTWYNGKGSFVGKCNMTLDQPLNARVFPARRPGVHQFPEYTVISREIPASALE